jgi:hypothetical protein
MNGWEARQSGLAGERLGPVDLAALDDAIANRIDPGQKLPSLRKQAIDENDCATSECHSAEL